MDGEKHHHQTVEIDRVCRKMKIHSGKRTTTSRRWAGQNPIRTMFGGVITSLALAHVATWVPTDHQHPCTISSIAIRLHSSKVFDYFSWLKARPGPTRGRRKAVSQSSLGRSVCAGCQNVLRNARFSVQFSRCGKYGSVAPLNQACGKLFSPMNGPRGMFWCVLVGLG